MTRIWKLLGLAAALAVAACASVQQLDAAGDVHALLIAIRDDDQPAFDAHVDRPALQREIEAKVMARVQKRDPTHGLAALLGPAIAQIAGDNLIQPAVFRMVAEQYGYGADTKIPPSIALATVLKELPDGRVCTIRKKTGACQLVFTKEDGGWKLTSFEGDTTDLRLKG